MLRTRFRALALLLGVLGLILLSCTLSDEQQAKNFISLAVPDSLRNYDDIRILILKPGAADTLDTLWNGPLQDSSALKRLPADRYGGGDVDVVIQGMKGGFIVYRIKVEYRGPGTKPVTSVLPIGVYPDTIPPVLVMRGQDSLVLIKGWPYVDSGAVCMDDRDAKPVVTVHGSVDPLMLGRQILSYDCRDSTGNESAGKARRILVVQPPDTTPPVHTLLGKDTVVVLQGDVYVDAGATCVDDLDSLPTHYTKGELDTRVRGWYTLAYKCFDHASNYAADRVRSIHVIRAPDAVSPLLGLRGPETIILYQDQPFADSGADCMDDRDGRLPVTERGSVDTHARATYTLIYGCVDSAGNAAPEKSRSVQVVRVPDADKPVLVLTGADTLSIYQGLPYADPGAACRDLRDGTLPVKIAGTVDTQVRGIYTLTFSCADSVGNTDVKVRHVVVARLPDAIKPVITLRGKDSVVLYQDQPYADSGAVCLDDRDGAIPVVVTGTVDVHVRAYYTLSYACKDSAGNAAAGKTRSVRVIRVPDTDKPSLKLSGADSVGAYQGQAYTDPGAACQDARDGVLPVRVDGAVDTKVRGPYFLTFSCADSAGNTDAHIRKVQVLRVPDPVKPVITLLGSDSESAIQGKAYVDSGAVCLDDRDGSLPSTRTGTVNSAVLGYYPLTFSCADSAGNQADAKTRIVHVQLPPDVVKPVISLIGMDTVAVTKLVNFDDPGATCVDDRDGARPVSGPGLDSLSDVPGIYHAVYSCADKAGNTALITRVVKSGLYTINISSQKETQIDTITTWQYGATGGSGISNYESEIYLSTVKFDLSKVNKTGLKSAKIHLFTWGTTPQWPGTRGDYTFRIYAIKSDWTEGTGNWFYYEGAWQNGGQTWFTWYGLSDAWKAASTNPGIVSGVTGSDKALLRTSNLTLLSTQKVNLHYDASNGASFAINPPDKLVVLELDVTDYVKNVNPAQDFGFHIKVEGLPAAPGRRIGFLTREVGDGTYAPRLMLSY